MKPCTVLIVLSLALAPVAMAQAQTTESTPTPAAAPATATAPTTPAPAAPVDAKPPSRSNKWRIKFDESSKSDGTIVFRVWPHDGEPKDVSVTVTRHQTENSIARATRDAMRAALGKGYKVETDDGEDVLVKAASGTKHFGLQLLSSSAKDVDISFHKE